MRIERIWDTIPFKGLYKQLMERDIIKTKIIKSICGGLILRQFPTHIVAVFGIVENEKEEVLLLKHRGRNVWMFPGGQVETGENLIEALLRETKEESSMEIEVGKLFSVSSNTSTYEGYNGYGMIPTKVIMGFTCTYKSGEFRESDETCLI